MQEPMPLVTAADIALVADVPLSSVRLWLKCTMRPPVAKHDDELLYLPSAAQALLDAIALDAEVSACCG